MKVTHRVMDFDGSILGYMADGQFVAVNLIKDNIEKMDNLTMQENGVIKAGNALEEIDYKNAVIIPAYKRLSEDNPFQRNIQIELEQWRKVKYRQVLQLGGP